ncbi:PQQ-binding-like beta-propeller repeat protein [Actinomycetospora chiangmaiensis]|uniref:outer membrane protein assembly factor BamB family protein n=1 Tax=Actinomycetospora chiangmaiensis TaxID=402650 RepID=UPI000382BCB8|nr:PQQ-binding-like beta-propeller repeat protein [Actinomycetospora chiangmaiensis]
MEVGTGEVFGRFLARVPEIVPDVASVVVTGDLTDLGLDEEYAALHAARAASPVPLHLLPGNHDHMNGTYEVVTSRYGHILHTADPAGYERHLGPRWYSFDLPGLHVVALDWHTHELGIDHEAQDAWIRADLGSIPSGTPWILLAHDQPWTSILDGLPWQPVATFSGHRHASRVVEVGATLHVNTPTPLFGALDFSPPSLRVVTWDGDRIGLRTRSLDGPASATFSVPEVRTVVPTTGPGGLLRWRHQLAGAGHRAAARVHGDTVLVAAQDEDRAAGGVEALDLATGALRWRAATGSAVKGTPAFHGDTVIAVAVSGDTVGLDLADGTERWRVPSPDPLRLFAFADPVVVRGTVVVGDVCHLRAHDATTGALCWERRDLSDYQSIAAVAAPVLAGDVLVVGTWPWPPTLIGLDPATGRTVWPAAASGGSAIGTPLHDGGVLYFAGLGFLGTTDAATGAPGWRRPLRLPWNPASPVATDRGIAVIDAGHEVLLLDRATGDELWRTRVEGDAPFALSSYQRTPHPLFAGPALFGERLLVPGLDGGLHVLDAATGAILRRVELGVPVAAPPVVAGGLVLLVRTDGGVLALDAGTLREADRS